MANAINRVMCGMRGPGFGTSRWLGGTEPLLHVARAPAVVHGDRHLHFKASVAFVYSLFPWHSSFAPALRKLIVTLPVTPS